MKKNLFLLMLVHLSNYLFPLLVLPYQMRVLSVDNFSKLMLIQSVVMMMALVVNFGYNLSATKEISKAINRAEIDKIYSTTIIAKSILFIIVVIVGLIISLLFYGVEILLPLAISLISLTGNIFFSTWLFQGIEKIQGVVLSTSIAKIIAIGLTFYMVKSSTDLNSAIFTQNLGVFLSGIISFFYIKKNNIATFKSPYLREVIISLKQSLPYFLSIAATSIYTYMNIVIISIFSSANDIANFAAADKLRMAVQALLLPISQAVFPRVNKANIENRRQVILKFGKPFVIFGLCLSLIIFLFGMQLSNIYFGDGYEVASKLFWILFPMPFIISLSIFFSQYVLIPYNEEHSLSYIYFFGAVLHICYSLVLVYMFGVLGMLVSVILTELFIVVLMYRKSKCYLLP